jgi:hypothetical protein
MSVVHDSPVFLIGGGRDEAAVLAAHRPFTAALAGDGPVACIVLDEGDETDRARWRAICAMPAQRTCGCWWCRPRDR